MHGGGALWRLCAWWGCSVEVVCMGGGALCTCFVGVIRHVCVWGGVLRLWWFKRRERGRKARMGGCIGKKFSEIGFIFFSGP